METVATVRFTAIVGPTALHMVRCGLGGERARTYSAILATDMATERPASDQASQVAVWVLTPLTLTTIRIPLPANRAGVHYSWLSVPQGPGLYGP